MSISTYLVNLISAKKAKKVAPVDDLVERSAHSSNSDISDEAIEIKGDQFSNKQEEAKSLNLKSADLWALGLTTAIGGHYFAWNAGLSAGFGSFFIALFLMATAYLCVVLCIAELSSALPFAGTFLN